MVEVGLRANSKTRTLLLYALSLANCPAFYVVVSGTMIAKEISHRVPFVAIPGCATHNIAPMVVDVGYA